MSDWWVPAFIGALPVVDWFFRWLKRFDQNIWEGDLVPPGWIAWGWVLYGCPSKTKLIPNEIPRVHPNGLRDHRYIVIRLPSWEWAVPPWHVEARWLQRALCYFAPFGWHMQLLEPL